jgi:uncharacterized protein YjbI with pentapeptide repeats
MGVYLISVHLMGMYLINVHLIGVHLMGVYLTGVHFMSVYLTGVHLVGVYLIGVYLIGELLRGAKLAPVMRQARVVSVSMADGESAEPLLEGSAVSREHPASGKELQRAPGGVAAERRGAGWVSGKSKAAGA